MPTRTSSNDTEIHSIPVDKLLFDHRNPRLALGDERPSQQRLLEILWRDMAVDEVALSIAKNGYFLHEPLFVEPLPDKLVVVEGNRRLAAVKLLLDSQLRQRVGATDLPKISSERRRELQTVPTIRRERKKLWQYIGFKHVNGPQPWESYSKAQYIAWVHNHLGVPLDDIAEGMGDKHATVQRLYRGLMTLRQAEDTHHFSLEDRTKKHFSFSHLYTGLDYPGIQRFLGISKDKRLNKKKPVPPSKIKNLGELCEWLYGSKSKNKRPVVKSQNPDLRILDETLQNANGIAALRKGLPLTVSSDIGRGDETLFREAIVLAKQSLEDARGKLLTGFKGERDLIDIARSIHLLATSIFEEMEGRTQRRRTVR
jgi:hypothetical protein